jgi:hypothetical protein
LSTDSTFDRISHHKKVKEWFLNLNKFRREIENEQRKHSEKCIYHLSKSHPTADCNVKKECDKLLMDKKDMVSTPSTNSSGQLRHITEETFEDAVSDTITDGNDDVCSNDTNEADLLYFARMTNHYLRLVKVSSSLNAASRHDMKYPIIADSGANYHMFKEREFFDSIRPASGKVFLGDGKTKLLVKGIGTVKCKIGDHVLCLENVRYIPDLSESIYSLFLHIRSPGHGLHSTFDDGLFILFPTFRTKAILGTDDIYLDAAPFHLSSDQVGCNSSIGDGFDDNTSNFCRNVKQFQSEVQQESKNLDNIMKRLRQYYKEIKTKRQLNLEVPAGFRQSSTLQRDYSCCPSRRMTKYLLHLLILHKNLMIHKIYLHRMRKIMQVQTTLTPLAPIYLLHPSIFLLFVLLINHLHHFLQKYQCLKTIFVQVLVFEE